MPKAACFCIVNRTTGVFPIRRLYDLEAPRVCVGMLFGLMESLASMRTNLHTAETAMPLRALAVVVV
jgi:hypothetical protein